MPKKLRLDLDNLTVESFATTPNTEPPRGTVFAQTGGDATCNGGITCAGETCDDGTYVETCAGNTCVGVCVTDTCPTGFTCGATCDFYTICTCAYDCTVFTFCGGCETANGSCTDQGCTACGNVC